MNENYKEMDFEINNKKFVINSEIDWEVEEYLENDKEYYKLFLSKIIAKKTNYKLSVDEVYNSDIKYFEDFINFILENNEEIKEEYLLLSEENKLNRFVIAIEKQKINSLINANKKLLSLGEKSFELVRMASEIVPIVLQSFELIPNIVLKAIESYLEIFKLLDIRESHSKFWYDIGENEAEKLFGNYYIIPCDEFSDFLVSFFGDLTDTEIEKKANNKNITDKEKRLLTAYYKEEYINKVFKKIRKIEKINMN